MVLERLLERFASLRRPDEGVCRVSKKVEHLGALIYTEAMRVYVTDWNVARV